MTAGRRGVLNNPKGVRRWCGRDGLSTTELRLHLGKKKVGYGGGQRLLAVDGG
ncbi:hypothetical protein A2U01_0105252 [Trifolium medium]|uniref:Uncharacterized protein n=1 Tax=Trifolium medium TaxID=97028 RepID=A0A392V6Q6_9FABA|nr:hypothetical protein [Trifolium medium]